MSACSLCCLFHRLVLFAVFLWCVDGLSYFVIGLIGLFLHVDCFVFFCLVVLLLCCCFSSFLIGSLHLFCAACYLKQLFLFVEVSLCAFCPPLIVVSLVVSMSICLVFVVVCCVTDASQPYTHTRAKFPHTGSQSSPAALWQSFWTYFSLLL